MLADSNNAPVAPIRQQLSAPPICTYLFPKGHRDCNCFRRKPSPPKASPSPDVPVTHDSGSRRSIVPPQVTHPPPSRSAHACFSLAHAKWCVVHEAGNHSTDECSAIYSLKYCHFYNAFRFDKLSGDGSHLSHKDPG